MEKDSFQADPAGKTHTKRWVVIFLVIGALRIASTYRTFSETIDEPVHFSAGLEILARHQYTVQYHNPPLPRLMFAIGPWLDGTRYDRIDPPYDHLKSVFQSPRGYLRTLALARMGNLIFFLIAAVATWMWARKEAGEAAALATLFLFTTEPVILGYSGLVTHDAAAIAGVALAILALLRWIERPTIVNAILLGAAFGFGVACKFSCIAFTPLACGAILLVRIIRQRRAQWLQIVILIVVVPVIAAAVVWVSYGFSINKFIIGVRSLAAVNRGPYTTYLFGHASTKGWWWYFPVTVLLKTTLPLLLLVVAALFAKQKRVVFESLVAAVAILAMAMTSPLDLGIRYVLPIFVPLSVAAGIGLVQMFNQRRAAAALLIAWQLAASALAHPDYFPYFNELAGREPSRFLIDSNLDWGQDVLRLSKEVRRLKIDSLGVALFSNSDLDALGFPPRFTANAFVPTTGWTAISEHIYRMDRAERSGWRWLDGRPYRLVGKSIRLYNVQ